jgi:TRAP-type C4-dicarboxylate transport system permease small subunit
MIKDMIDKQVLELKKLWANKRQLLFQLLNLAMIVFSALMIWKGLMFMTKVRRLQHEGHSTVKLCDVAVTRSEKNTLDAQLMFGIQCCIRFVSFRFCFLTHRLYCFFPFVTPIRSE